MKYFANFLVVLSLVLGCEGEDAVIHSQNTSFFPLQTGAFQLYDVEERRYQLASNPIESRHELMIHIVDSFPTGPDEFTYVIHRSRRAAGSDDWEILDTWSVRNEQGHIVVVEGNTGFVKLRLPLTAGSTWNGNAYNALAEDEYTVRELDRPFEVRGKTFERTVTVEQEDNDDIIVFRDQRKEVYAQDVGLIYKEVIQLDYCTADQCLGLQKVDEGFEMKMTIVDYGVH